jgi:hypothetical protein
VTIESALRFLEHEAQRCRELIPTDRDAHEMFCLLLPSLRSAFQLEPMEGLEARAFRQELKEKLNQKNSRQVNSLALSKK